MNEIYQYDVNGQKISLFPFVKEFRIPQKDKLAIDEMKKERGFIENDAISYVRDFGGKKALNEYIGAQKAKYMKKDR